MHSTLVEWLKNNDLERFGSVFEDNEVDLETLRLLTRLRGFGVGKADFEIF